MSRVCLRIAYDGTEFAGWQVQPATRTVAGEITRLLEMIYQAPIRLFGSSRTDAGVHASGQVAHFDAPDERDLVKVGRSLNSLLREEVVIQEIRRVPPDFHARFDARWRRYRYRLRCPLVGDPLERRHRLIVPGPLDLALLEEALPTLLGERDFSSFRSAHCGAASPMRRLLELRLEDRSPNLDLVVSANAFLQQMVRILVGTLLEVGRQRLAPADLVNILEARDRNRAGPTISPKGLCLEQVGYSEFSRSELG